MSTPPKKSPLAHRYSCKVIIKPNKMNDLGECTLALQAFINGKKKEVSLGIYIKKELWDDRLQKIIGKGKHIDDFNLIINNAKAKASNIFVEHRLNDIPLTPDGFRDHFALAGSSADFIKFCKTEVERLKSSREKGSIKNYNTSIVKFNLLRKKGITFADINLELVEELEGLLRGKLKLKASTRWKHHKDLKFFINRAINKGIKIKNPYDKFKIIVAKNEPEYLTTEELNKLQEVYENKMLNSTMRNCLRAFLFSCFTGLRISDIKNITTEMLIDRHIVFTSVKTRQINKIVKVPINLSADKYFPKEIIAGKLFIELPTDQRINNNLKKIAGLAGIKKSIHYHMSRHTFAFIFLDSGGDLLTLQKLMGHSKIETTMRYVHLIDKTKVKQMSNLDKFANVI